MSFFWSDEEGERGGRGERKGVRETEVSETRENKDWRSLSCSLAALGRAKRAPGHEEAEAAAAEEEEAEAGETKRSSAAGE